MASGKLLPADCTVAMLTQVLFGMCPVFPF